MIKVLVSSQYLFDSLKSLGDLTIDQVRAIDNKLVIDAGEKFIQLSCEFEGATAWMPQNTVRWDWIFKTVACMSDRPIVLIIDQYKCKMELSF